MRFGTRQSGSRSSRPRELPSSRECRLTRKNRRPGRSRFALAFPRCAAHSRHAELEFRRPVRLVLHSTTPSIKRGAFMPALSLLLVFLVTFVVILLVLYLVNLLPIEGRLKQLLRVIVIILAILSLVRYFVVGF